MSNAFSFWKLFVLFVRPFPPTALAMAFSNSFGVKVAMPEAPLRKWVELNLGKKTFLPVSAAAQFLKESNDSAAAGETEEEAKKRRKKEKKGRKRRRRKKREKIRRRRKRTSFSI
jgi:transposase